MDFLWILFKVTRVTTKRYGGYYCTPKIAGNKHIQREQLFFGPEGKKKPRTKPFAGARNKAA